jgi:hypothetical protein
MKSSPIVGIGRADFSENEASANFCQYITVEKPHYVDADKCGLPQVAHSPYCTAHHAIAFMVAADEPSPGGAVNSPLRSSFPRVRPATPAEQLEAMRQRAWIEQGVVTFSPDDIADAWLRQAVLNMATKRWGARPS